MTSPLCLRHRSSPVVAVCHVCGEGLCDACWTFVGDGKPICAQCVHVREWAAEKRWSRLVVFVIVLGGLSFWLSRHVSDDIRIGAWIAAGIIEIVAIFMTASSITKAKSQAAKIERREIGSAIPVGALSPAAHPVRARLARIAFVPDQAISARTTAVIVGFCLLVSGVLLPVALRLPRWIEFEIVLAVWWALLAGLLAVLLLRGTRVREDHEFRVRWNLPELESEKPQPTETTNWWHVVDLADPGCVGFDGCGGMLVGIVLAAVAFAAAWFVVELVFPAIFFLLYWLVVKAIARVANDHHDCEGSPFRAIEWGMLWATAYTLPIGAVVWCVHLILRAKGHG
jgi:hypothetical protein